jgi:hypothetical protein
MKNILFSMKKTTGFSGNGVSLLALILMFSLLIVSCKKDLDVKNPNDPTFGGNVNSEDGLAAYAKGAVYWNGFNYGNGWLGDSYFSLPWGYHELMGDVAGGGQGSNNQTTTMGVPDYFFAVPGDASTKFTNPSPQALGIIRVFNTTAATANANNALFYEWNSMYSLINSCNITLENLGGIALSADKANTVKAWCYWWKGFAYAQIGSIYYAGLIVDKSSTIVSDYVSQDKIIAESNRNLTLALNTLNGISNTGDYGTMIGKLIPAQCQVGLGLPPTRDMWVRTINTMLARNILLNKLAPFVNGNPNATITKASIPVMTAADWTAVTNYCNNGVKKGDYVFTGRTSSTNSFFSATSGSVAAMCAFSNQSTTYKVSERLVQNFKTGDNRRNNFSTANGTFYGDANTNSTRWTLRDGVTAGLTGIPILGSRTPGGLEIYIGPTWEENTLMLAEANIRSGNVNAALPQIDAVRAGQGAGVPALAGTTLTAAQAMSELTMERGAALAFRALSFCDARRWGWTYDISRGGGRYGATLIFNNNVYTNATISYNFMDYWDVPADEIAKNPPSATSAPTKNANY